MIKKRKSAGELSKQSFSDNTKYNALEVGHAMADDIHIHVCLNILKN